MANLIPPHAKREIMAVYWMRVVTVWGLLVGSSIVVVIALLAPTYLLIKTQLSAYEGVANDAELARNDYRAAQATVKATNDLSDHLYPTATTTPFTEIYTELQALASSDITVRRFSITRNSEGSLSINVTGLATTRTALATFRDTVESHPFFAAVDLPISNLAKDRNIVFNLEITPTKDL